jgi:hypothetical protein
MCVWPLSDCFVILENSTQNFLTQTLNENSIKSITVEKMVIIIETRINKKGLT